MIKVASFLFYTLCVIVLLLFLIVVILGSIMAIDTMTDYMFGFSFIEKWLNRGEDDE